MSGYRRIRIAQDLVVGWFEQGGGFVDAMVMDKGLPKDAKLVKAQLCGLTFDLELTFQSDTFESMPPGVSFIPLLTPLYATKGEPKVAVSLRKRRQIVLDDGSVP